MMQNPKFRSLIWTLACLWGTPNVTHAQNRDYPPVLAGAVEEVYKTVDDIPLKLWIFNPPDHKRTDQSPAIVFFFGGGWRGGSPAQFEFQCRYLAEQGVVAITADYRVSSRHKTLAIQCVEDGKSAIRWVRQHADRLGIDPDRVVAAGGSAGGHVAACTGIVPGLDAERSGAENESSQISSVPNALALFNPPMMLAPLAGLSIDTTRLIGIEARTGIDPQRISPIHHIRGGLPPTIIFHGDQDSTVPYESARQYAIAAVNAGNECELATYRGFGHGFFNAGRDGSPGEAYRLTTHRLHQFLQSLGYIDHPPSLQIPKSENAHLRSDLDHSRIKFETSRRGTVAFIGGSITQMDNHGHSGMIEAFLSDRFPNTEFHFVNAGISSTCSTTGAFRLQRDVLRHDPDLLFIEFAVNDDQDAGHSHRDAIRGMEGIIRQALAQNPKIDIVVTYFVNDAMLKQLQNGQTPLVISAHESVTRRYGVASCNLAREVAQRITDGSLTWEEYGGTHPVTAGNRIAADLIEDLLTAAWAAEPKSGAAPVIRKPIDNRSYDRGRLLDPQQAQRDAHWKLGIPDWSAIAGALRAPFADSPLLHTDKVGAQMSQDFSGTAIGMYVLAGPDAGMLEYSIDGADFQQVDLFHHYSAGLHYPRTVMLSADLEPGDHQVVVRVADSNHPNSKGHAIRILHWVAN